MSAKSPVPAPSAAKQAQTSGHLLGQACRRQRKSERSHEAQDRQRTRTRDDHPTLCHGGAGVWKRTRQQEDEPLYLAREKKVDGQWKLYCMVQNIEKLAHHGYAQ